MWRGIAKATFLVWLLGNLPDVANPPREEHGAERKKKKEPKVMGKEAYWKVVDLLQQNASAIEEHIAAFRFSMPGTFPVKQYRRLWKLYGKVEAVLVSSRENPGSLPLTAAYIRASILRPLETAMGSRLSFGHESSKVEMVGVVSPEDARKRRFEEAVAQGNYIEID